MLSTPTFKRSARIAVLLLPAWLMAMAADAQRRNPRSGEQTDTSRERGSAPPAPRAVPRREPAPAPAAEPSRPAQDSDRESGGSGRSNVGSTAGSRARGDQPAVGEAVPRTRPPSTGGRDIVIVPGGYGYGGFGYGGYGYGGYYDPYGCCWDGGGYYWDYEPGKLRLKVKPTEAAVYVDGYYAGVVDDFDGIFQRLRLQAGPHRIEVQEPGYQPISLDVHIEPGRTITYRGNLQRLP